MWAPADKRMRTQSKKWHIVHGNPPMALCNWSRLLAAKHQQEAEPPEACQMCKDMVLARARDADDAPGQTQLQKD